jgi:hypothetical protein
VDEERALEGAPFNPELASSECKKIQQVLKNPLHAIAGFENRFGESRSSGFRGLQPETAQSGNGKTAGGTPVAPHANEPAGRVLIPGCGTGYEVRAFARADWRKR